MSTWMNDAVQTHNGNGFPMNDPNAAAGMMDPSAFMANQGQFNPAQFQNQQQQAQQQMPGMQNGPMRNASPSAFQNSAYQTNPVIPSKRPRPREESLAGSPSQHSQMLPTSRSQTPQQQGYSGFQSGSMSQGGSGQFSHLQANGSANASPSPIMGNQMRPGSVPQRVATASPHPFSPSNQQFGSQASPIPSEHGTPQPNQFMQNMPQGYNPNVAPSPSNARPSPNPNVMTGGQMMPQQMGQMHQQMGQMPNNMYPQMQHHQQAQQQPQGQQPQHQQQQQQGHQGQQQAQNMSQQQKMAAYQMRLQQQAQGHAQMQAQMAAQNMGRSMMPKQQMAGMPNGQGPQGQAGMRQRPQATPNPEQFMKNLSALMQAKGLPLETNPVVADRPVNLMMVFQAVQSKGSYKTVTSNNLWGPIAAMLGLPAQLPNVGMALKQVYERNLLKFEEVWMLQHRQKMMQQQQQQHQQQPQSQQPQQPQSAQQPQHPGTPQKPMHPGHINQVQMPPGQQQQQKTPMKPGQPVNGFSTPQATSQGHPAATPGHGRNSIPRGMEGAAQHEVHAQSPAHIKSGSISRPTPPAGVKTGDLVPIVQPKSDEYTPCGREPKAWGGWDLNSQGEINLADELSNVRPDVPPLVALGNIDIASLTRSLQSGIIAEVRLALDTLATVSNSPFPQLNIQLKFCDDLVDALVDCAEEQLEFLAEHTVEVSYEIQLSSYEEVVRACRLEQWAIKETPVVGTNDYALDRAVERLVCVTTILRNLSFSGDHADNHIVLAEGFIVKFLSTLIRYLGTRNMLLRTHANTLDLMKDLVILLSNIAGSVELANREQALCLLQFLLAFSPSSAHTKPDEPMFFPSFEPRIHTYLPHAVDAMAKLLARDEPNRTHYKMIFALDTTSDPAHELLSRAFALSISTIRGINQERHRLSTLPSLIDTRRPYLMQGLLAAEILVSMAPNSESNLVRSWISPENGLVQTLNRLLRDLCKRFEQPPAYNRNVTRGPPRKDPEHVYLAVLIASVLRRLAEKAYDPHDKKSVPVSMIPSSQSLMESMSLSSPEWTTEGLLRQLSVCFNLGQ